jgi:Mrp family chromosome partitioning ATPase
VIAELPRSIICLPCITATWSVHHPAFHAMLRRSNLGVCMAGRVITVAQQKGGSGKTTIIVNLAVAYLRAGHRVALLDTDPQGSLGRWFMARRERGAADMNARSCARLRISC